MDDFSLCHILVSRKNSCALGTSNVYFYFLTSKKNKNKQIRIRHENHFFYF